MTAAIGEAGEGTGTGLSKKKESELHFCQTHFVAYFSCLVNLLNGVTGLATNSVSQETGYAYIQEGSGKTERPLATIRFPLLAADGLINSSSFAFACCLLSRRKLPLKQNPPKQQKDNQGQRQLGWLPGMSLDAIRER
ncbi:hypothetical protein OPV22_035195 [Ensete ventricosum]|uniref:Uncharacterized protein n=1 Tax=Ensete ventricosum TaxID=4639 RepID=A0AAX5K259_ENSVE|nr:hypothetical protein OPV22_035195 [Ensete ventricosum]